jgi:ubiquitin carboxyl-terminal hydrolase L5
LVQALLSVVMNQPDIDLGPTLTEFKSFVASFPPDLKGEAIGSSDEMKAAHNSFARKDAFLAEGRKVTPTGEEELFHFVAYIPFEEAVYELDGLQSGPIRIGTVVEGDGGKTWMDIARDAIQQRMEAAQDVKFNLMAVTQDKRIGIEKRLKELEESDKGDSPEYAALQAALAEEEAKRHQWKLENQRRKHNYVPLCVQLLKELARKGSLPELVTEAQERVHAKRMKKAAAAGNGN